MTKIGICLPSNDLQKPPLQVYAAGQPSPKIAVGGVLNKWSEK
jgi:hypothetical protein